MGAGEITVIVVVSAVVAAIIVAAVVRKLKGKPPLNSDCCDCPYHGDCKGGCGRDDAMLAELRERYAQKIAQNESERANSADMTSDNNDKPVA